MTARAKEVYSKYLAALSAAWVAQSEDLDGNLAFATATVVGEDERALAEVAKKKRRLTGRESLKSFKVQSFDAATQSLHVYTCTDVSEVRVLDSKGHDITPSDRADLQPALVSFGVHESKVLVEKNGTWRGRSSC